MQQDAIQRLDGGLRKRGDCAKQTSVSAITAIYNGENTSRAAWKAFCSRIIPALNTLCWMADRLIKRSTYCAGMTTESSIGRANLTTEFYDAWNKGLTEARRRLDMLSRCG